MRVVVLSALALFALLLFACIGLLLPTTADAAVSYSAQEIEFVRLFNEFRTGQGLQPVLVSDLISEASDRHNSDMAKYRFFSHYTTNGSDWFAIGATPRIRMAASGYSGATYTGENIAAGYPTAQSVFDGWKNSSGHRANMLNSNFTVIGISLTCPPGAEYNSYWTLDFGSLVDYTAHPLPVPEPTIPCPYLLGTDRFDTAIRISKTMYTGSLPAGSGLVLAPGETFQEALCGAPLAAAYGGPVLLTPTVGLNNAVREEIIRLSPAHVICIGLSDSIVAAVQTALGNTGVATAIRGSSVYDMSRKVALALEARVGDLSEATAIVTRGDLFPDAIGVSPLACAQRWPVLLTGPTGALESNAAAALADLDITKALKVGTYAILPPNVEGVGNLSGADRYVTNRNVAVWSANMAGSQYSHSALATGDKFPDALAAGPYLALDTGILFLTPLLGPLPVCIDGLLSEHSNEMQRFSFIAIIEPVLSEVKSLLP